MIALLLGFLSAAALAEPPRLVQVSGACVRKTAPDRGQVTVTSEVQDMDGQKAARAATERFEKFKKEIERLNLPDLELQTVEYSVNPVRDWEKDKSVFKGYRVRIGTRVTTSAMAKLGEVAGVASRVEIKDVGSLSTILSEDKQRLEQRECLKAAALDAQARAEKLATTLGARLGKALAIREQGLAAPPMPPQERVMMAAEMKSGGDAAPAPRFDPGTQEVRMAVDVTFELN